MQVIEQTRDEKLAMYQKLTKRELAEMLVNANDALRVMSHPAYVVTYTFPVGDFTTSHHNNPSPNVRSVKGAYAG